MAASASSADRVVLAEIRVDPDVAQVPDAVVVAHVAAGAPAIADAGPYFQTQAVGAALAAMPMRKHP